MLQESNQVSGRRIDELARQACDLLAEQTEFLKSWGLLSEDHVREYALRQSRIEALILAISRNDSVN
jgi:hypothetical protein